VWTMASGRLRKKIYDRPSYISKFIQKLPADYITDVKVFVGELVDVSSQYVPGNFDPSAHEARVQRIEEAKRQLDLRSKWFTEDNLEGMEWFIHHPHALRASKVADRVAYRWERIRERKRPD
jgi:hypothetical protein